MYKSEDKYFYGLFCGMIAVNLFWMIYLRVYPFTDLPIHLLNATVVKFYNEPGNFFSTFFVIPSLLKSNTFHLFFTQIFSSIEFGNKVYYCLYVILMPVSVLLLIKKLNGNKWFALLSFFFVYNFNVMWGFVGYTVSVPALLIFLLLLIDFIENPKWIYVFGLMISLPVMYLIHMQTTLFAVMVLFAASIYDYRNFLKNLPKKIIIIAPVLVLVYIAWDAGRADYYPKTSSYLMEYYSGEYWLTFHDRIIGFFLHDNTFLFEKLPGWIAASLITIMVLFPIAYHFVILKRKGEHRDFVREGYNAYAVIFLFCALACYFILPRDLPGQSILHQRFAVFVLVSAIACCSLIKDFKYAKIYSKIVTVMIVIYMILISQYFYEFENEAKVFTKEIFPKGDDGKVLAGIINDYTYRGHPTYIHFPSYYTVWNNGITVSGNVDYRFTIIRRNVSMDKLPPHIAFLRDVNKYNNEYKNVDYIIVKDDTLRAQDGFKLEKVIGDWQLYNKLKITN